MGLDVSLKYSTNREQALAEQRQCEEFSDKAWAEAGTYDSMSEEDKNSIRERTNQFNATMDCDDWGSSNKIEGIEMDSKIYPDNMFKIGYLRSSYNEGGVNHVLRRINTLDLYGIFGVGKDHEYYITPDWTACLERVNQVIVDINMHMDGPMALYDVVHVRNYGHGGVGTAADALKILEKELENYNPSGQYNSYGNRDGDFFLDGMEIVGVVPATGYGGGVYLLTKNKESNLKWYLEAITVTREMIEHVLAQPDPENYFLGWSA